MTKVKVTAYTDEIIAKRLKVMAEEQERSVTYLIDKALIEVYGENQNNRRK